MIDSRASTEQAVLPSDPVYSRLLEARWAEVALARLREEADFLEKRTKLANRGNPNARKVEDAAEEDSSPAPKAKARQRTRKPKIDA